MLYLKTELEKSMQHHTNAQYFTRQNKQTTSRTEHNQHGIYEKLSFNYLSPLLLIVYFFNFLLMHN